MVREYDLTNLPQEWVQEVSMKAHEYLLRGRIHYRFDYGFPENGVFLIVQYKTKDEYFLKKLESIMAG